MKIKDLTKTGEWPERKQEVVEREETLVLEDYDGNVLRGKGKRKATVINSVAYNQALSEISNLEPDLAKLFQAVGEMVDVEKVAKMLWINNVSFDFRLLGRSWDDGQSHMKKIYIRKATAIVEALKKGELGGRSER